MIGLGGRFSWCHGAILKQLKADGRINVAALCDIYRPRLLKANKILGGKMYDHHKELLADPNVDVVCIATPDRHHAIMAIDAIRAGKDVYSEKPMTHWTQFDLAKQLEEEATKNKKIVQIGTQWVADTAYDEAKKYIKQGVVGEIKQVQCGFFRRGDWGEALMELPDPNAKPGPDLDWEAFWAMPRRCLTTSRDSSAGACSGIIAAGPPPISSPTSSRRCSASWTSTPRRASVAGGGLMQYPPPRELPDQFTLVADYAGGPSVTIMNSMSNYTQTKTILRGTDGAIIFDDIEHQLEPKNEGLRIVPATTEQDKGKPKKKEIRIPWNGAGDTSKLWSNFLDCVKSRQRPFSPIDIGVRVQAPLVMGILSFRENKVATFDKANQKIIL